MNLKKVPVGQINPALYNPRKDLKPDDTEYQNLEKSITNYGYIEPVVWNSQTKNLVGGHQRFKILVAQGLTEIDVSVVALSLEKEKALNLALNKIRGRWDDEKLNVLISELTQIPDIDMELTGFSAPEISNILDQYESDQEDDFDVDAAVADMDQPITQKGDIVELGCHRVMCGDSALEEDVSQVMQSEKIGMVMCDYPYNCCYRKNNRPSGSRVKNRLLGEMIQNDSMPQPEYELWFKNVFCNIKKFMKPGTPFYIWNGYKQFGPMIQILIDLNCHISNVITWVKPSLSISYSDYSFQSEFCLYGWVKGDSPHKWFGSTRETNIWEVKRDSKNTLIHQNQKPVELISRSIKNSSVRGDIVFDGFLGSGVSVICAEQLGRRCYGMEIEPKYCDAIVRRYIAYVGRDNVSDEIKKKYMKEV